MCISIRYRCSCCRILCYCYFAFVVYGNLKVITCYRCSFCFLADCIVANRNIINSNASTCRNFNYCFIRTYISVFIYIIAIRIFYCYIKGLACRECISFYFLADSKASLILCIGVCNCCGCGRILCYGYIAFSAYNKSIIRNRSSCLVFTYGVSSNRDVINCNVSVCRYCDSYFRITYVSIFIDILACRICYCYIKSLACRKCISCYCLADSKASLILCISICYLGCCSRILCYGYFCHRCLR